MPGPVDVSDEEEEIDLDQEEEEVISNRISQSVKVDAKFLGPGKGAGKKARKGGSIAWGDCRLQQRVAGYEAVFKGAKTTHMCIHSLGDGKSCNSRNLSRRAAGARCLRPRGGGELIRNRHPP